MKRIALCFDGTWNEEEGNAIRSKRASNVALIYQSILGEELRPTKRGASTRLPAVRTLKWYDEGVGTEFLNRIRGGIFGDGLSRNIREGYKVLADAYEPGDQVYLFGFSRGAYTARSLAGFIRKAVHPDDVKAAAWTDSFKQFGKGLYAEMEKIKSRLHLAALEKDGRYLRPVGRTRFGNEAVHPSVWTGCRRAPTFPTRASPK